MSTKETIRFVDLFAGMGGTRIGFQRAAEKADFDLDCVLTSEIKPSAVKILRKNFPNEEIRGDITEIRSDSIPEFDILLGGFPCQAFSVAGKQRGFADTRGTLFFEIERFLAERKPYGFLLENVEGLVLHDREKMSDPIGRTLSTIIKKLEFLGYEVNWKVLDAQNFGVAQARNRVYIVGTKKEKISLEGFEIKKSVFADVMEKGLQVMNGEFSRKLFGIYKIDQLYGKAIKDKRGGENNIHSWDLGLRGDVTQIEKDLLNSLLKERRKRKWASIIGIDWMDGMPLTAEQIKTFHDIPKLKEILDGLVRKGYLVFEHPKQKIRTANSTDEKPIYERIPDITKPKGYNIVTGKLSFQFSRILCPNSITPTLVAMDMSTIGVIDNGGIRKLTLKEGLRLFGYPESYSLADFCESKRGIEQGFDLLGNTVCVPVIEAICERLIASYVKHNGGK